MPLVKMFHIEEDFYIFLFTTNTDLTTFSSKIVDVHVFQNREE